MAHPQTNFSSNFQGVDPPLEGYWHDDPIPCGGGNVVTDIYPNPAGVPIVVKGINALTAEDIANKLDDTGNASNTTSTFTKASGDTSTMASGGKLSAIFTAISSFFASLKALAFKDKASYNDLSSGVQSSLNKADSALQSHQSVTDNNPTLSWEATSKVGTVGSTDLRVTMPSNPASGKEAAFVRNNSVSPYVIFEKNISTALYDGQRFEMVSSWGSNTYKIVGRLRFPSTTSANPLDGCSFVFVSYPEKPTFEFYYKLTDSDSSTRLTLVLHLFNVGNSVVTVKPSGMSMDVVTTYDTTGFTRFDTFPTLVDMRDASWINSGTFGTNRIADDAVTADKVKDNETLPVNVSGNANGASIAVAGSTLANSIAGKANIPIDESNFNLPVILGKANNNALQAASYLSYYADSVNGHILIIGDSSATPRFSNNNSHIRLYRGKSKLTKIISQGNSASNDLLLPTIASGIIPVASALGVGSNIVPVYVDGNGQVQPCTAGDTLKSNTATLYIAGYTDNNIPIYNVKDIKNGCVNHVDFSNIASGNCDITFEAPTLATGEEYDYVISLEGYTNNTGVSTGSHVENCKQVLHYDYNSNLWVGEGLFLQATDWRQICIVRGNTCEWKRVTLS